MRQRHKPEVRISGHSCWLAIDPLLSFAQRQQMTAVQRLPSVITCRPASNHHPIPVIQIDKVTLVRSSIKQDLCNTLYLNKPSGIHCLPASSPALMAGGRCIREGHVNAVRICRTMGGRKHSPQRHGVSHHPRSEYAIAAAQR